VFSTETKLSRNSNHWSYIIAAEVPIFSVLTLSSSPGASGRTVDDRPSNGSKAQELVNGVFAKWCLSRIWLDILQRHEKAFMVKKQDAHSKLATTFPASLDAFICSWNGKTISCK